MYPPALKSPYSERRSAFGKERYSALGIAREDWEARQRAALANWDCFGAPAALFCYVDRDLGLPQRADVGQILSPPDGLILFCGMSIAYEDVAVGSFGRAGCRSTRRS